MLTPATTALLSALRVRPGVAVFFLCRASLEPGELIGAGIFMLTGITAEVAALVLALFLNGIVTLLFTAI